MEPVDLEELAVHWRLSLNAAQDAVEAAARYLPATEERTLRLALAHEREEVALLVSALARELHVQLVQDVSAPRARPSMLGLPPGVRACVFELEGVLTSSPALHEAAWAETFDSLLLRRAERAGERYGPCFPFSPGAHHPALLEGRTRLDGVRSFLANRGIQLRKRTSGDPPRTETIHAPADRERAAFNRRVEAVGVRAYPGSAEYLDDVRDAGLKCAFVSASAHTAMLLERTGLAAHLDARVNADAIAQEQLRTWPAPDVLLAVCARLGVPPHQAAVFETEPDGVAAGRTASFAVVVGVDRGGNREALLAHGADVVVGDLSELLDPVLPLAA